MVKFLTCTFLGHRKIYENISEKLELLIINLIENHNVDNFYFGNQGEFDFIVKKTLQKLKQNYPHIKYTLVLSYMPTTKHNIDYSFSIFPEDIASTPPQYAIIKRNIWMIEKSDCVVVYVKYPSNGASKFKEMAEKKSKIIFTL